MATRVFSQAYGLTSTISTLALTGLGPNDALLISSATVVNFDTVSRTFTCNLIPPAGSVGNNNLVEYKKALSTNQATNTALSGKTVAPGGAINAGIDSGTSCTLQISGTIISQAG